MKRLVYIFIAFTLVFVGCKREEDAIFEGTSMQRLQSMRTEYMKYLVGTNCWELRYFPYPNAAGYAFLCDFDADGSVLVAAKNAISSNNFFKTERSLWDIDYTQSLVLSFKSYNDLLTIFADPYPDGIGYNGDYEFVILQATPSYFRLKGKKHGAYIDLTRLDDVQDWESYFAAIDALNDKIFVGNEGADFLYVGNDTILHMTYDEGYFTYSAKDEEYSLGFVVTPDGIHFYSQTPNTNGIVSRDFRLSDNLSRLECINDEGVYFTSDMTPVDMFEFKFTKDARWLYKQADTDEATNDAFEALHSLAEANGALINRVSYSRIATLNTVGKRSYSYVLFVEYTVDGLLQQGFLNLRYKNNSGASFTFQYNSADVSITPLLERLGGVEAGAQMFADIFCDTFVPKSYSGSQLNMVEMLLESSTTAGKVIHVLADTKSR